MAPKTVKSITHVIYLQTQFYGLKIWRERESSKKTSHHSRQSQAKQGEGTVGGAHNHSLTHGLAVVHASHSIDPSLSSQTHTKPNELRRELPKVKPVSIADQAHAHLPPLVDLPSLFSLLPTKVESDITCHWSSAFTQEPHPLFHSHSQHSRSESISPSLHSKP